MNNESSYKADFSKYAGGVNNFATITRKQASVIYRNYKEGNLDATEQQIDMMYTRYVPEGSYSAPTTDSRSKDVAASLRTVVNALFADDYPAANAAFQWFLDKHYLNYSDMWFPDDR